MQGLEYKDGGWVHWGKTGTELYLTSRILTNTTHEASIGVFSKSTPERFSRGKVSVLVDLPHPSPNTMEQVEANIKAVEAVFNGLAKKSWTAQTLKGLVVKVELVGSDYKLYVDGQLAMPDYHTSRILSHSTDEEWRGIFDKYDRIFLFNKKPVVVEFDQAFEFNAYDDPAAEIVRRADMVYKALWN